MNVRPSSEALATAERWRLDLSVSPRGGADGDSLGAGVGSSMEFHDRRPYQVGDDVRHVDWRAMARTDEVLVRVHREEVSPRLDLIVDASASMAVDGAKAQATIDLTAMLISAAGAAGYGTRLLRLGDTLERVELDQLMRDGLSLDGRRPLMDALEHAHAQVRPRSVRILVSDFLAPADPRALVQRLAASAGPIALIQVLGQEDARPTLGGAVELVDSETGAKRTLVIDAAVQSRYSERLRRLAQGYAEEALRARGIWAPLVAGGAPGALAESLADLHVLGPR